MLIPCSSCQQPMDWSVDRVGDVVMLYTRCVCDGSGPWHQEPVDVIRKPRGRATLWPPPRDVAPCDVLDV